MDTTKKSPKICAVCGQVLDQWLGNWIHTAELAGMSDHIVVPVDYDEALLVAHCDFCHDEVSLADRWTVPADDFLTPIGTMSGGNWMACPTCARLVTANDWDALIERPLNRPRPEGMVVDPERLRVFVVALYGRLRTHQTGPPRPFRPGDEATEYQQED